MDCLLVDVNAEERNFEVVEDDAFVQDNTASSPGQTKEINEGSDSQQGSDSEQGSDSQQGSDSEQGSDSKEVSGRGINEKLKKVDDLLENTIKSLQKIRKVING